MIGLVSAIHQETCKNNKEMGSDSGMLEWLRCVNSNHYSNQLLKSSLGNLLLIIFTVFREKGIASSRCHLPAVYFMKKMVFIFICICM